MTRERVYGLLECALVRAAIGTVIALALARAVA